MNHIDYKFLQRSNNTWFCILCCNEMNNMNNTCNEIKSVITIKILSSDIPKSLYSNVPAITYQVEISNVCKNYFVTIAEKTK